jgi:hypothetical protein
MSRFTLNPFRRRDQQIAALQEQLASALETQAETNAAFAEQIAALVRDDEQIIALRRIQGAVEYLKSAEQHDRESSMKRHMF